MARSQRLHLKNVGPGVSRHNHNWDALHKASAVTISAAQWRTLVSGVERPWLSDGNVFYVTNIGPHDPEGGPGGVEFFLHAEMPENHRAEVMLTITVFEDVESTIEA